MGRAGPVDSAPPVSVAAQAATATESTVRYGTQLERECRRCSNNIGGGGGDDGNNGGGAAAAGTTTTTAALPPPTKTSLSMATRKFGAIKLGDAAEGGDNGSQQFVFNGSIFMRQRPNRALTRSLQHEVRAQLGPQVSRGYRREGIRIAVAGASAECCRGFVCQFARATLPTQASTLM